MTSTAEELILSFVERIEHQNERIAEEQAARKAIYDEAKGAGLDVKALRAVVKMRQKTRDELAEEVAMVDLYASAVGLK